MSNFHSELAWSLSLSNTSTAVSLLSGVWPAQRWVTTCSATNIAGVDFLTTWGQAKPLRVDVKYRRISRWHDPLDPDTVWDVEYVSSDGQRRDGPVKRYMPSSSSMTTRRGEKYFDPWVGAVAPPADFLLFAWPDAEPPMGLLVNAERVHRWLSTAWVGLEAHTSATTRADGQSWVTRFVVAPASAINANLPGAARLLTLRDGTAAEYLQAYPPKRGEWSSVRDRSG